MAINMKMARKGDILTIEIDLAQEHGHSKAGKTITVAKTGGFISVPGAGEELDPRIILNVNCNKRRAESVSAG